MNREDSAKVGGWLDHASKMARAVAEYNAEETIAALTAERDNALAALRRRSSQRDQLDERCEELVDQRDRATARAERAEDQVKKLDEALTLARTELSLAESERLNYRGEIEMQRAILRRVRAVEQNLWEQVAQLKSVWLVERANMDPFERGRLIALQEAHGDLLAALDGTDNTGGTDGS